MDAPLEQTIDTQIYFCDNPSEISILSRKDLPGDVWDKVRQLQNLDTRKNWRILFFYGLWAAAGWIAFESSGFIPNVFAVIVMALCVNGLPILMHDACHVLLSKNVRINRWLGFVCGLPGLVAVSAYRSIHSLHHKDTRTPDDPDDIERNASQSFPLVLIYYAVLFIGVYIYIGTVAAVGYKRAHRSMRQDIVVEYLLMAAIVALAFVAFSPVAVLKVWILPLLIAAQLANVRGISEHGLTTGGNPFTNSRTVISNKFVSFFMCNLNYHLEHHLFPGVPYYNLPKLHELISDIYLKTGSSVYRSYTLFLIDFFRTTWKGLVPNARLIPRDIREGICG
jgi:fatty acid desaturase